MAYEVFIKYTGERAKKSPIAGNGTSPSTVGGNNNGDSSDSMSPQRGVAKSLVAVNKYIKPFVDQMVTQHVTTVSLRTGAQELEERMSFKMQVAQKIYGFGTSVITGALIGGGVGAVVGGVMSLATMAVDYSNKRENLNLQRSAENIGLRYMNTRAGGSVASFSGSRMKSQ